MVTLKQVEAGRDLEVVRALFLEYAQSLHFNLCFQQFDKELRRLPGPYAAPAGRLILCECDGKAAGCVAVKALEASICEMKRLYVRPEFRGRGLGRQMIACAIEEAARAGYTSMRLDTIAGAMDRAIALYRTAGFRETPAYCANPIPGALYFELTF